MILFIQLEGKLVSSFSFKLIIWLVAVSGALMTYTTSSVWQCIYASYTVGCIVLVWSQWAACHVPFCCDGGDSFVYL